MRNGLRALNVAIWTAEKEHNLDFDELMELKAKPRGDGAAFRRSTSSLPTGT